MRKGILLSGGKGTRLRPITQVTSKQLLPVYDKPMVYYSLSILMLAGVREVLLITDEASLPAYKSLFGDGSHLGLRMEFSVQLSPKGLSDAFVVAEEFLDGSQSMLILGDNFFHGQGLSEIIRKCAESQDNSIVVRPVVNPSEFGVCQFSESGDFLRIVEKPKNPPSNLIATGVYFFNEDAPQIAKNLSPSPRGELEIADMINYYASDGGLMVEELGRGCAWIDTGSFEGLFDAASYVRAVQRQHGFMIGCLEEIALEQKWISPDELQSNLNYYYSGYRTYLEGLMEKYLP